MPAIHPAVRRCVSRLNLNPRLARDRSTLVGREETSSSGGFSDSRGSTCDASLPSHFRTARVCARTHVPAAKGGERSDTLEMGIERDEFIVFWKELAITGSNMQ